MKTWYAILAVSIILNFLYNINAFCIRKNNTCVDTSTNTCMINKGKEFSLVIREIFK